MTAGNLRTATVTDRRYKRGNCLQTMETLSTVFLKPGQADRIIAGHPWIYHGTLARLNRPTPEGRELGAELVRLTAPGIATIAADGEPDARCASCAFRAGTIPNGCIETQADALKAVMEGSPFYCHMKLPVGTVTCHGWYAGRVALRGRTLTMPWKFSTEYGQGKVQP